MRAIETITVDHSELVFWVGLAVLVCWFWLQQHVRIWSRSAVALFRVAISVICFPVVVLVGTAAVQSFGAFSGETEYGQASLSCLALFLAILYLHNAIRLIIPPRNRTLAADLDPARTRGS